MYKLLIKNHSVYIVLLLSLEAIKESNFDTKFIKPLYLLMKAGSFSLDSAFLILI